MSGKETTGGSTGMCTYSGSSNDFSAQGHIVSRRCSKQLISAGNLGSSVRVVLKHDRTESYLKSNNKYHELIIKHPLQTPRRRIGFWNTLILLAVGTDTITLVLLPLLLANLKHFVVIHMVDQPPGKTRYCLDFRRRYKWVYGFA